LKFFPAEASGGLARLKAMSAPYQHLGVRFVPLGGVNEKNMSTYLADPLIAALGGSWLAPREAIMEKRWSDITGLARQATTLIGSIRPK
jgi:2-dehydro-3-deoxyphosphogluconate aldolase/(4S)-4-hydroxy-2-oxoglutarate aldolase